jgi:hypothetical protein
MEAMALSWSFLILRSDILLAWIEIASAANDDKIAMGAAHNPVESGRLRNPTRESL